MKQNTKTTLAEEILCVLVGRGWDPKDALIVINDFRDTEEGKRVHWKVESNSYPVQMKIVLLMLLEQILVLDTQNEI